MAAPAPTLLSNFEVLYTLQFPPGIGPLAVQQADESVIKGFFLTISNPSTSAYRFDVGFHCNVNPGGAPSPLRTLASATAFLDDGTAGTPLTFGAAGNGVDFSLRVPVAARGTVLVGVLPQIFLGKTLPSPNVEIRGWVDIKLPALLQLQPVFVFVAQSANPVTVIATPEQRLTFLPIAGDAAAAVEAQTAFSLPLAAGRSSFDIPPQPGGPIILQPQLGVAEIPIADIRALEAMSPETLGSLLGHLTPDAKKKG